MRFKLADYIHSEISSSLILTRSIQVFEQPELHGPGHGLGPLVMGLSGELGWAGLGGCEPEEPAGLMKERVLYVTEYCKISTWAYKSRSETHIIPSPSMELGTL